MEALGPVSRILFRAGGASVVISLGLALRPARPRRGRRGGHSADAAYPWLLDGPPSHLFCLAPEGVFRAAPLARRRGGLLPHLFTITRRHARGRVAWLPIFCDTIRRRALKRAACARLAAGAASCPTVSGLSSPNFWPARHHPRLGIKELGATTRPQSLPDPARRPGRRKPAPAWGSASVRTVAAAPSAWPPF